MQELSNLDETNYRNDTVLLERLRINMVEELDTILKSHYIYMHKTFLRILKVYFPIFPNLKLGQHYSVQSIDLDHPTK